MTARLFLPCPADQLAAAHRPHLARGALHLRYLAIEYAGVAPARRSRYLAVRHVPAGIVLFNHSVFGWWRSRRACNLVRPSMVMLSIGWPAAFGVVLHNTNRPASRRAAVLGRPRLQVKASASREAGSQRQPVGEAFVQRDVAATSQGDRDCDPPPRSPQPLLPPRHEQGGTRADKQRRRHR
jgi:hypothetical protein